MSFSVPRSLVGTVPSLAGPALWQDGLVPSSFAPAQSQTGTVMSLSGQDQTLAGATSSFPSPAQWQAGPVPYFSDTACYQVNTIQFPGGYNSYMGRPGNSHQGPQIPQASQHNPFGSQQQRKASSPDAWINDLALGLANPITSHSGLKPPRVEVPKFDGNPHLWPLFIQSFKAQVHDTGTNDAVRLSLLRGSLSPEIQDHIGEALINPNQYSAALTELQRRFGKSLVVTLAFTASLLNLKPFEDGHFDSLKRFSLLVRSAVSTLGQSGYSLGFFGGSTLIQISSKLPPILKMRWTEVSWRVQPKFAMILEFDR